MRETDFVDTQKTEYYSTLQYTAVHHTTVDKRCKAIVTMNTHLQNQIKILQANEFKVTSLQAPHNISVNQNNEIQLIRLLCVPNCSFLFVLFCLF